MKTIDLTLKQQNQVREFQIAIQQLQQRQEAYLKAVIDANDVSLESNWRLTPDLKSLALVEPPPQSPKE